MSMMEKLKKNSTIKDSATLAKSKFFTKKDMVTTSIPAINIALSGRLDGGLTPGLTMFAGPSKHFKTLFSLLLAKAYMDKYPDAAMIFYDSEFGTPMSYFESMGIDTTRVLHTPFLNIEQLKIDVMGQVDKFERGERIIMVVDSIGNSASKKEVEDAIDGKSVADMTRAKSLNGFFRMVTPYLNVKDIPMVVVNRTYKTMELYAKDVVSGGCLVSGTKIQLSDGSTKSVEDFIVDDLVKTTLGTKEVTHVWNPDTLENGEPECFEIEFEDGYKVICSDKHKFLVDNKWIEAKDLIVNQEVQTI